MVYSPDSSPVVRATPPPKPSTPIGLFPVRKPSMSTTIDESTVAEHRPQQIGTPANVKCELPCILYVMSTVCTRVVTTAQHKGVTWSPVLVQEMQSSSKGEAVRGPPLRSNNTPRANSSFATLCNMEKCELYWGLWKFCLNISGHHFPG